MLDWQNYCNIFFFIFFISFPEFAEFWSTNWSPFLSFWNHSKMNAHHMQRPQEYPAGLLTKVFKRFLPRLWVYNGVHGQVVRFFCYTVWTLVLKILANSAWQFGYLSINFVNILENDTTLRNGGTVPPRGNEPHIAAIHTIFNIRVQICYLMFGLGRGRGESKGGMKILMFGKAPLQKLLHYHVVVSNNK